MSIKTRLAAFRREARAEFNSHVAPLLTCREVQKLDAYVQHVHYTRLKHSVDVAYISFCIAKLLRCDTRSTARAGLLHDMFYRDDNEPKTWKHMRSHPREALKNARQICALNPVEEDIILKHMWLVTLSPPRYKESYIVTFVDKFCAMREFFYCMSRSTKIRRSVFDTAPQLFYHNIAAEDLPKAA